MLPTILFFFAFCLVFSVCRKSFSTDLVTQTYSSITVKVFLKALFTLCCVLGLMLLLFHIPYLKYGWMHLILPQGGTLIGTTVAVERSLSGNPVYIFQSLLFFALFLYAIPHIVQVEEELFRKGAHTRRQQLINSIKFGLAHCLLGLPLGVGLSLIFAGWMFGTQYRTTYHTAIISNEKEGAEQKALFQSALLHSTYNALIVCFAISLIYATLTTT